MLEPDPSFRPVRTRDGYLPLEDLGMIGDGSTAALVGLNGSICWLCLPRFDSEPLFCGLLDRERGGHFDIAPDGRQLVFFSPDREGKPRLWLAPLDRRSPPRQIPDVEGEGPLFGPNGEIFFRKVELKLLKP